MEPSPPTHTSQREVHDYPITEDRHCQKIIQSSMMGNIFKTEQISFFLDPVVSGRVLASVAHRVQRPIYYKYCITSILLKMIHEWNIIKKLT